MREIYFGEFRIYVIEHIRAIEAQNPDYQSTEWFLLRYLSKIEKNNGLSEQKLLLSKFRKNYFSQQIQFLPLFLAL